MLKTLFISAALIAGTSTFALAGVQTGRSASDTMTTQHMKHHKKVLADGRCNGKSYGTGQGSCGTKTGGTPGGNPNKN